MSKEEINKIRLGMRYAGIEIDPDDNRAKIQIGSLLKDGRIPSYLLPCSCQSELQKKLEKM
jgi:hypothetical protein